MIKNRLVESSIRWRNDKLPHVLQFELQSLRIIVTYATFLQTMIYMSVANICYGNPRKILLELL